MATRRLGAIATSASAPDNGGDHSGGGIAYIEDAFSTYLYTGKSQIQRIVNGVDLDGEGGLVWTKTRELNLGHVLFDTERGGREYLATNTEGASSQQAEGATFNSDGFTLNPNDGGQTNFGGRTYASWTFRKAKKFFDVVTYTGDGVAGLEIPHNLGAVPGMIIVKRTDSSGDWNVYHRSTPLGVNGSPQNLRLNSTSGLNPAGSSGYWTTAPTADDFTIGDNDPSINSLGATYVAYLFAHDDSDESNIACGKFTGITEVDLGWEPQYILTKVSSSSGNWEVFDTMRGIPTGKDKNVLRPNLPDAESNANNPLDLTPTGFNVHNPWALEGGSGTADFIYMAIRKPDNP